MSCARFSSGGGARNPSLRLGSSSSTCSSSTCSLKGDPRKAYKISDGWTKKSIGGLGAAIEGICGSSGKRSRTKEIDREARK